MDAGVLQQQHEPHEQQYKDMLPVADGGRAAADGSKHTKPISPGRYLAYEKRKHRRPSRQNVDPASAPASPLSALGSGLLAAAADKSNPPAPAMTLPPAANPKVSSSNISRVLYAPAMAAIQQVQQSELTQLPRPQCAPLSIEKLAAVAVNFTVMLMTCDHSSAPQLLHHWLGNVRAANISYFLIAAADDATSAELMQQGLEGHCYRLAGTHGRVQSSGVWLESETAQVAGSIMTHCIL
jgi:hypothetical protein